MFSNLNPRRNQANLEASKRRLLESTYTTPLGLEAAGKTDSIDADLHALRTFLHGFYREFYDKSSVAKRQKVLDEYAEMESFHERLVILDTVSEEEFWQRYYYRCDPEQILLEWDRHPERGRQVMGETVSSWFKKAVSVGDNSTASAEAGSGAASINKNVAESANTSTTKTNLASDSSSSKSRSPPPSDSVSWFDAKFDSVRKAWVLPKEDGKETLSRKNNHSTNKTLDTKSGGNKRITGRNTATTKSTTVNSNNIPTSGAYVPPHKRGKVKVIEKNNPRDHKPALKPNINSNSSIGGSSNNKVTKGRMNTRAAGLRSDTYNSNAKIDGAKNGNEKRTENADISYGMRATPTATNDSADNQNSDLSQTPNKKNNAASFVGIWIFCCSCVSFLLVFSQREQICASNKPIWSSLLLCLNESPPMEQMAIKVKPGKNKKLKFQNDKGYGNDNFIGKTGGDANNSGDSMVNNLISSWTQSTDMAQLLSGGMMEQQHQQHPSESTNGIALLPYQHQQDSPKKKKRSGPIQFLKRKFGRDRHADNEHNALAVNGNGNYNDQGGYGALSTQQSHQPQMVVHQHVHHVVHHVVHEYAD